MSKGKLFALVAVLLLMFLFGFNVIQEGKRGGQLIYSESCAACHGPNMEKLVGRSKLAWDNKDYVVERIKNGNPAVGMPPFKDLLVKDDIDKLVKYLLTNLETLNKEIPKVDSSLHSSKELNYTLETVVDSINIPWGMTWLPN
ncbi:MAG: cytochrome c, partial [Flavobacteriales bacterium]|nr:cytochrome c [Flavobacteriales bacterium]